MAALLTAALALAASGAAGATAAGDWRGAITPAPSVTLHLALHLSHGPNGAWTGALDSLDQAALGLPLADIAVTDETLSFAVPSVRGTFTGHWDAMAKGWAGTWTQGARPLPLTFVAGAPVAAPTIVGLDGAWDGALDAGAGMKLRLALHFATGPYGTSGSMDSIDQDARGLPLSHITRDGARVSFDVPSVGGRYEGTLDAAGGSLTGTWSQGAGDLPLAFARRAPGQAEARMVRPQTPKPPFPYKVEEVTFEDPAAQVRLAGTLTVPEGKGPFPAVVLIVGSGPHDRDETIFGHRIFLVLADHLTRHGIAVLRYDKRGVGGSTGDYGKATPQDFADDAQAAVAFLGGRAEIAPRKIGLVGHSEGGLIAPMVAARDPAVAFIVLMAGPGVNGAAVLEEQRRLISVAMGVEGAQLAEGSAQEAQMIDVLRQEADPATASARLKMIADAAAERQGLSKAVAEAQVDRINTPWFRAFLAYDPAPALERLRIPVLALIGSKDMQVAPDQNLPALRAALAHDPKATVEELPGLNHLFQPAATGAPSEYQTIETTIAPTALDLITDWIGKSVR